MRRIALTCLVAVVAFAACGVPGATGQRAAQQQHVASPAGGNGTSAAQQQHVASPTGGNGTSAAQQQHVASPTGGNGTSAAQQQHVASPTGSGGDWTTTGSASIAIGGTTVTLSPGGCLDGGSVGVDFRFGGWSAPTTADWVVGIAFHDGSKPTAISGGLNGKMYVLGEDRTATIGADGKGTFSGTDTLSNLGKIRGTFSCS